MNNNRYALSLFSSAGIGELGIKAAGYKILLSNELLSNRKKSQAWKRELPPDACDFS